MAVRADAPGWSVNAVRRAVREARTDGWSDALIVEALAHIASDVPRAGWAGTQYPARLRHWLAAEARKQAAPENGETLPLSYAMPADRPRCQTHPGYPGDNCTACLKDAEIAEAEMAREAAAAAASVVPREQAGAAARAAARALIAQRHGRAAALAGKPFAGAGHVTAERSTQLAQLAEMSNA